MQSDSAAIMDVGLHDGLPPVDGREALVYALSWTAYPGLLWRLALRLILLLAVYAAALWLLRINSNSLLANWGGLVIVVLALAWTFFEAASLRATQLIVNVQGVWLAQGLLPWHKGVRSARWDDIGAASYEESFLSWACNSYRVTVSHRATAGAPLNLAHVKNGPVAVQSINRLLLLRAKGF